MQAGSFVASGGSSGKFFSLLLKEVKRNNDGTQSNAEVTKQRIRFS